MIWVGILRPLNTGYEVGPWLCQFGPAVRVGASWAVEIAEEHQGEVWRPKTVLALRHDEVIECEGRVQAAEVGRKMRSAIHQRAIRRKRAEEQFESEIGEIRGAK